MIEKLKEYRNAFEAKKAELLAMDINIEPAVEEYRNKMIADAEAKKNAEIAKIDSDIDCIDKIIASEEASAVAEPVVEENPQE